MRLVLTWLVGVPILVFAMVLARAMSPQGLQAAQPEAARAASACPGQRDVDRVAVTVAKDGHRVACDRNATD